VHRKSEYIKLKQGRNPIHLLFQLNVSGMGKTEVQKHPDMINYNAVQFFIFLQYHPETSPHFPITLSVGNTCCTIFCREKLNTLYWPDHPVYVPWYFSFLWFRWPIVYHEEEYTHHSQHYAWKWNLEEEDREISHWKYQVHDSGTLITYFWDG